MLTGKGNFRNEVAFTKPYKGNRKKEKPTHYQAIRDYMVSKYHAKIIDGEEADDYLGYTQYAGWLDDEGASVIVTIDKDLDTIPGLHFNPVKEQEYYVDEEEANRFFLTQLISGDAADNIPGIPGMGPKKATKFLEDISIGEGISKVRTLYDEHYGDDADRVFDEQATLLWIRRSPYQTWQNYWNKE